MDDRNRNSFAEWTRGLQKIQRIKLRSKLDDLQKFGPELPPGILIKTEVEYIYKLKVQGNPKLRPMLCFGPVGNEKAFTLLIGAKEISWDFVPQFADTEAGIRRKKVLNNPNKHRKEHERIN
ncbi:MAG TPA: hypothetical protein VJU84_07645 [Pyrinomonadaceae bacterium]|nr:hypothetical protein [Pyrinomonadaceae bacterium]